MASDCEIVPMSEVIEQNSILQTNSVAAPQLVAFCGPGIEICKEAQPSIQTKVSQFCRNYAAGELRVSRRLTQITTLF